jgi:erythromycin esterase
VRRFRVAVMASLLVGSGCGGSSPAQPTPDAGVPDAEVVAWAQETAAPLATVEAGHGFADLAPLAPRLEGKRVVALGEATHGTREFFQLKHRLVEYLVQEQGFTVFALEGSFGGALAANAYVLNGTGTPEAALDGLFFWAWQTEEMRTLLEWMRAYNADPTHLRKLHFYGLDVQSPAASVRALRAFLGEVDPAYLDEVDSWLSRLESDYPWAVAPEQRPPRIPELAPKVASLQQHLDEYRAQYEAAAGGDARDWAAAHARALAQYLDLFSRSGVAADTVRDQAMADNALWLLEHEGPGARMILWAHNAHVARGSTAWPSMGNHLAQALGDQLYVFGFGWNRGQFRASNSRPGEPSGEFVVHTVGAAPAGTLDDTFARVGRPLFALDLRSAPTSGPVAQYLDGEHPTRDVGWYYYDGFPLQQVRLTRRFDGLLFVETTTSARPLAAEQPPQARSVSSATNRSYR